MQILATLSILFGAYIVGVSWYNIYVSSKTGRNISPIPFLGAFFLFIGLRQFEATAPFALLIIFTDLSVIGIVAALFFGAKEGLQKLRQKED